MKILFLIDIQNIPISLLGQDFQVIISNLGCTFYELHSGHGFKLAPVVGKLLAELSLDLPSSYDLQPFKLSRLLK